MKTSEEELYFIAVTPPEPVYSQALDLKKYFAERYSSKAALRSAPHITLHMPFRLKPAKETLLSDVLRRVADDAHPFKINLHNFGQFKERTIYIRVEDNNDLYRLFKSIMRAMKVNFNIFNADYKSRGFNPHLTVAFRDLKKEEFRKAWPEFEAKTYSESFEATSLALLKHNGKTWDVFRTFEMTKATPD